MNNDFRNLLITVFLSTLVLVTWQYFFPKPKVMPKPIVTQNTADTYSDNDFDAANTNADKESTQEDAGFIEIVSEQITGRFSLKGLRFDDVVLKEYKETISPNAKDVRLFQKAGNIDSYFSQFGWLSSNPNVLLPDKNTIWKANKTTLSQNDSVELEWTNSNNIKFLINIELENDFLFSIKQTVINNSKNNITLSPYALIYRIMAKEDKPITVVHEGPIGVFDNVLTEQTYNDLYNNKKTTYTTEQSGWFGFSDKYWLSAFIPDSFIGFKCNMVASLVSNVYKYQVDYIGPQVMVGMGENFSLKNRLFVGPKKADMLNQYEEKYKIPLFDRAVDYGWFYFLTKPMFTILSYLYKIAGNFGIAIILMTLLVKIIMFPVANKSYKTMKMMKMLNPQISAIRSKYSNDPIKMNSEIMALYKKEKLNPVSGCLPMFLQIPVFFSLYKVIFISIEMRHAPFFGWIKDLSVADPVSFVNLCGLIPIAIPQFLMIGIWPTIMGVTMYIQQKLSPPPADPMQAKVMSFLPLLFVFMFHSFPAGLMIYWSFSNILSIIQQKLIKADHD